MDPRCCSMRRVAPPDGLKSEKIRPTLKSLKYLATKLTPVVTPIPVIHPSASQLWIDLNLSLEHINATSETIVVGVAACRHARADCKPNMSSIPQQRKPFTWASFSHGTFNGEWG